MINPKTNYAVDFLMVISFIITSVTGLITFFFLPSGIRQGSTQTFLGIIKGTWSFIHDWNGIVFIALVILHFVLHWDWIVSITKSIFIKNQGK